MKLPYLLNPAFFQLLSKAIKFVYYTLILPNWPDVCWQKYFNSQVRIKIPKAYLGNMETLPLKYQHDFQHWETKRAVQTCKQMINKPCLIIPFTYLLPRVNSACFWCQSYKRGHLILILVRKISKFQLKELFYYTVYVQIICILVILLAVPSRLALYFQGNKVSINIFAQLLSPPHINTEVDLTGRKMFLFS